MPKWTKQPKLTNNSLPLIAENKKITSQEFNQLTGIVNDNFDLTVAPADQIYGKQGENFVAIPPSTGLTFFAPLDKSVPAYDLANTRLKRNRMYLDAYGFYQQVNKFVNEYNDVTGGTGSTLSSYTLDLFDPAIRKETEFGNKIGIEKITGNYIGVNSGDNALSFSVKFEIYVSFNKNSGSESATIIGTASTEKIGTGNGSEVITLGIVSNVPQFQITGLSTNSKNQIVTFTVLSVEQ
jgi:hypothetical protein